MVVVVLAVRRDCPGVVESVENLLGEAFVAESAVAALGVAVLPGAPGSMESVFTGKAKVLLAPFVTDRTIPRRKGRPDIQR